MKIKLSKTQWEEVGRKSGWVRKAQGAADRPMPNDGVQTSPAAKPRFYTCPKCKQKDYDILSPSHPIINECKKCKHRWNPYNEKA